MQEKSGFIPNVFLAFGRRLAEWRAFFAYHDALMLREESNLTKGDREMIVTTTSAANHCLYLRSPRRHPAHLREETTGGGPGGRELPQGPTSPHASAPCWTSP